MSDAKKKYPNSEWVRRRNIRRAAAQQALKQDLSAGPVATEDSSKNITEIHSPSPKSKPKSWWAEMKSVFAGRRRNTKDAA